MPTDNLWTYLQWLFEKVARHMSDNCLMLVRPEYYQVPGEYFEMKPAEAHLILRKSKSGYPLNVVKLETDLKKQLFLNPTIYQSELI